MLIIPVLYICLAILGMHTLHMTMSQTVPYNKKIGKRTKYDPQNAWDFISCRYLLRSKRVSVWTWICYWFNMFHIVEILLLALLTIMTTILQWDWHTILTSWFGTNYDLIVTILPIPIFLGSHIVMFLFLIADGRGREVGEFLFKRILVPAVIISSMYALYFAFAK